MRHVRNGTNCKDAPSRLRALAPLSMIFKSRKHNTGMPQKRGLIAISGTCAFRPAKDDEPETYMTCIWNSNAIGIRYFQQKYLSVRTQCRERFREYRLSPKIRRGGVVSRTQQKAVHKSPSRRSHYRPQTAR